MALEALLVLPVVVVLVAAVLGTSGVVADQLTVARAARAAARSVAVTGDVGAAAQVVQAVHPTASASVRVRRGRVEVTVTVSDELAGVAYAVDATSVAPLEPGARP